MRHTGTIVLSTPRLLLRPFKAADAAQVYASYAGDPRLARLLGWEVHPCVAYTREYLSAVVWAQRDPAYYNWAVALRDTDEVIGAVSAGALAEDPTAAGIGYVLGEKWWGQGLMPEALRPVRDHLLDQVGFARLAASCREDNRRSARVLEKLGMRLTGAAPADVSAGASAGRILTWEMRASDARM